VEAEGQPGQEIIGHYEKEEGDVDVESGENLVAADHGRDIRAKSDIFGKD